LRTIEFDGNRCETSDLSVIVNYKIALLHNFDVVLMCFSCEGFLCVESLMMFSHNFKTLPTSIYH